MEGDAPSGDMDDVQEEGEEEEEEDENEEMNKSISRKGSKSDLNVKSEDDIDEDLTKKNPKNEIFAL